MSSVSILIPCYNAERWVGQAIESALAQTWPDKEVIVVDDGSTDGSLSVIKGFADRIRFETGPNRGGNVARNRLLELSQGEFLQYLDADDYLLPDKVANQVEFLAAHPGTDVVFGPSTIEHWSENESRRELLPIPEPHDLWILLARWYLPQTGAPLWRKQAIVDVGGWKPDQPCCQEHELYLRLLIHGKTLTYCPHNGSIYRQWSEGTVCKRDKPEVMNRRLEIEARLEKYLQEQKTLTPARQWAINMARFEMARTAWQYDRGKALDIFGSILHAQPGFQPRGAAAPLSYRRIFRILGFRLTETLADYRRTWSADSTFAAASPDLASGHNVLLLETNAPGHAKRSGYSVLADYLPEAELISGIRYEPRGIFQRVVVRMLNFRALTRWYRQSSFILEWRGWKRGQTFNGILHVMWADRDLGYLDLLRNRRRHRLCGTFHTCPDTFPENLHLPARLASLDAVILMSEVQRDYFEKHGVPAGKIHVVLHGVDTKFFTPPPPSPKSDTFKVLSVGSYRRNFPLLRKVCERLLSDRSVKFKIIAPPSYHKVFAGLDNVETVSNLSDLELLASYREAGCLLFTAESATANNALLEALACGLPVVSESIGGIPEYVSSANARLVEPGSDEALANAIRELAGNGGERDRMSIAARQRAEQLDWKLVAERTREVYRQLT